MKSTCWEVAEIPGFPEGPVNPVKHQDVMVCVRCLTDLPDHPPGMVMSVYVGLFSLREDRGFAADMDPLMECL